MDARETTACGPKQEKIEMASELFLGNGFTFDVFIVVTSHVIDAETYFHECKNSCTFVPVGNVVGVTPLESSTTKEFAPNESSVRN